MSVKNILKIVCATLIATSIILAIITLINYYGYVNYLNSQTNTALTELQKFALRENGAKYLSNTLSLTPWLCFTSIISFGVSIATHFTVKPKKPITKIR